MSFWSNVRLATIASALLLGCVALAPRQAHAQANNNNNNANAGNLFTQPVAGIEIDANGVLRVRKVDPALAQQRARAAAANLPKKLAAQSPMRKVSLNRLEAAVAQQAAAGKPLGEDLRSVAGLTAVEYVLFYPETGDIVIAGPAEGFAEDAAGCVRGIFSGRPTIQLEDLVVALRAFSPTGDRANVISVSIDPTAEGLARMQQFLRSVGSGPPNPQYIASGLKNNLGMQTVSLKGIPEATHFARVLVEADYRMKLVGIGLERLPVKLKSYVERANPAAISANSMERWFFVPNYDCIRVSEDGLAMRLVGNGVQLIGANERVTNDGQRADTGAARVNAASQGFCQDFTRLYPEIAAAVPVYAQLKNLIDLSIVAAYIQDRDFYGQANWAMPTLSDETAVRTLTHNAPQQVETAVNAIWKGKTLMTPLGGGIQMQPRLALRQENIGQDTDGLATQQHAAQDLSQLAADQWWWD